MEARTHRNRTSLESELPPQQVQRSAQEGILGRDQALSFWSGSTDSKTLDYQSTNPREYQIVRTHTKEPLEHKTQHHPTISNTLCRSII